MLPGAGILENARACWMFTCLCMALFVCCSGINGLALEDPWLVSAASGAGTWRPAVTVVNFTVHFTVQGMRGWFMWLLPYLKMHQQMMAAHMGRGGAGRGGEGLPSVLPADGQGAVFTLLLLKACYGQSDLGSSATKAYARYVRSRWSCMMYVGEPELMWVDVCMLQMAPWSCTMWRRRCQPMEPAGPVQLWPTAAAAAQGGSTGSSSLPARRTLALPATRARCMCGHCRRLAGCRWGGCCCTHLGLHQGSRGSSRATAAKAARSSSKKAAKQRKAAARAAAHDSLGGAADESGTRAGSVGRVDGARARRGRTAAADPDNLNGAGLQAAPASNQEAAGSSPGAGAASSASRAAASSTNRQQHQQQSVPSNQQQQQRQLGVHSSIRGDGRPFAAGSPCSPHAFRHIYHQQQQQHSVYSGCSPQRFALSLGSMAAARLMAAAQCRISTRIRSSGTTAAAHASHHGSTTAAALNCCGKITGDMAAAHSSSSGTLAAAHSAAAERLAGQSPKQSPASELMVAHSSRPGRSIPIPAFGEQDRACRWQVCCCPRGRDSGLLLAGRA